MFNLTIYRAFFTRLTLLIACLSSLVSTNAQRVVAYVTSWTDVIPDPSAMTNINYAFGHVKNSFDGVRIDNPSRLKEIASLKKKNRNLQVQLSIGGWGSGNFSEMAADDSTRMAFAKDCLRIVEEYGLDGIDIDWEYPGSRAAGISSSPKDKDNFILLMRDIRKVLGENRLLTMASPATVGFYEFKPFLQYVDFINVMTYDLNKPPRHNAPLYRSSMSGDMTADESINAHLSAGIPPGKIIMGIPFYGHGKKGEYPDFIYYRDMEEYRKGLKEIYDEEARVPYLADENGEMMISFDNKESVREKCRYAKEKSLGGIMYWEYAGDNDKGDLRKIVRNMRK